MTTIEFLSENYLYLGGVFATLVAILTYWYYYGDLHYDRLPKPSDSDGKVSVSHIVVDFGIGNRKPTIVTGKVFQFKLKFHTASMKPCHVTREDLDELIFLGRLKIKMMSNWEDKELDIGLNNDRTVGANGGHFINFLLLSVERSQENENEVMVKFQVDRISDEMEIESYDKMQLNIVVFEERIPYSPFIFVKNPSDLADLSLLKKTSWTLQ